MATLMLADSAQAIDNKLYILGGGWSVIGPGPTPSALAIAVKVPWDQVGRSHHMRIELVDSDGHPVMVPAPIEKQPLAIESEFQVEPVPGLKPGTSTDLALAVNLPPIPLPPGGRYEWRLSIDGEAEAHWHAAFSTRSMPEPVEEG